MRGGRGRQTARGRESKAPCSKLDTMNREKNYTDKKESKTDRQTTDRQTDGRTDRQTDGRTDRQTNEGFHKLQPANKTDHLCQSWQWCHVFMNPQKVLLSEKGAPGVSSRCEKVCLLLPQRSQGGTLKNHMLCIANSTTVTSQTNPGSRRAGRLTNTKAAECPQTLRARDTNKQTDQHAYTHRGTSKQTQHHRQTRG